MSSSSDDGGDACGLAKSRSRRERREKVGRKSALEQIKKAKRGEKVRYEVSVVHNSDYPTVCEQSFVFNSTRCVTA